VTDPKGEKPKSDHPHEDDLSLEPQENQKGLPGAEDHLSGALPTNASTDEFEFLGPVEELDFTEPADFTFPSEQPAEAAAEHTGESSAAEPAEVEGLFGAEGSGSAESPRPEEAAVEPEQAGEAIPDLEAAEEPAKSEDKQAKPKAELPPWVRTAEWVTIGVLSVGGILAIVVSAFWLDKSPGLVTLILNIACPVMLGLIPYALWRSMPRWVTPSASAVYTVMLALAAAALIVGTWFEGLELSRYEWQFSKARVNANKPRPGVFMPPVQTAESKAGAPADEAARPAGTAMAKKAAGAKNASSPAPGPAAAKGTAESPKKK